MSPASPSNAPKLGGLVEQSPAALRPWPNNPRTHSAQQLFKLKKSIGRFGFTIPLLVDEHGTILAGEARWRVASELKLVTIPTRVISGLSTAEKRAYVLADNKLALLSSWDCELLRDEIELLIAEDFEIDLTGFSTVEIDLMMEAPGAEGELQPADLAPELISRHRRSVAT